MNIEIRDAALQARIQKQVEATGSGSVEEVLLRRVATSPVINIGVPHFSRLLREVGLFPSGRAAPHL